MRLAGFLRWDLHFSLGAYAPMRVESSTFLKHAFSNINKHGWRTKSGKKTISVCEPFYQRASLLEGEQKKVHKPTIWLLTKSPQYLSNPHETWWKW